MRFNSHNSRSFLLKKLIYQLHAVKCHESALSFHYTIMLLEYLHSVGMYVPQPSCSYALHRTPRMVFFALGVAEDALLDAKVEPGLCATSRLRRTPRMLLPDLVVKLSKMPVRFDNAVCNELWR